MKRQLLKRSGLFAAILVVCCLLAVKLSVAPTNESSKIDLRQIHRSLAAEPSYASTCPGYAAIVFGDNTADVRWLVLDDDHAYFDRDGDRQLNESDEKVTASNIQKLGENSLFSESREFVIENVHVGDIQLQRMVILQLRVATSELDSQPADLQFLARRPNLGGMIKLTMNNTKWIASPMFGTSTESAPVVHFGGPLTINVEEPFASNPVLKRDTDLRLSLGTQGDGQNAFAFQSNTELPNHVYPEVTVVFANRDPTKPAISKTIPLKGRC